MLQSGLDQTVVILHAGAAVPQGFPQRETSNSASVLGL